MSAVLAFLTAAFPTFTAGIGWVRDRMGLNNSKAMQDRAAAATDQQLKDAAAREVSTGDLDQIRKDAAE